MALCVQPPFGSKTGLWNMNEPPTEYSTTGSDVVSASMAYQYPLPSMGMDSPSMIPSLHNPPRDHSHPSPPSSTKQSSPPSRSNSVPSKAAKIKRSMSTPNVRGSVSADAAALALSAEKKRNKLGYHRTSVACGHCRRRKIRCIPAPGNPQGDAPGPCSNCIRLKKECNFYAVDQQPQVEPKRRISKTKSGTGRASASSSPSTSAGQLPDMQADMPFPHLAGSHVKRQRTESFSPENKAIAARSFDYNPSTTNWMAADTSPSTSSQATLPQSYWGVNPQESPLTPAFSPFTPGISIPSTQNWPVSHGEPSPRDEMGWQVPGRSISYGNIDSIQNQAQFGPSNPQSHPSTENYALKGRPLHSSMYPPPISSSVGGHSMPEASPATAIEAPQHIQPGGPLPSHYSQWQQPYGYAKPVPSANEQYELWNAHNAPPQPSEPRNAGPMTFGYGDPTGGSYYPPPPSTPGR